MSDIAPIYNSDILIYKGFVHLTIESIKSLHTILMHNLVLLIYSQKIIEIIQNLQNPEDIEIMQNLPDIQKVFQGLLFTKEKIIEDFFM